MLSLLGHSGAPVQPHDLLTAWRADPWVIGALVVGGVVYLRGWRPPDGRGRALAFVTALLVIALALVSPVDAAADVLVSAHMVQHLLLVAFAAPLLAVSAPGSALLRGVSPTIRRGVVATRRGLRVDLAWIRRFRHAPARWLLFVATFWLWHASVLYAAAVEHTWLHVTEHVTFLGTSVLVWTSIVGHPSTRLPPFLGVIAVFGLALQSVLLSALMTFGRSAWYAPYTASPPAWWLDPLADQQLAGVIMWVPSGIVHTAIGIALVVRWLDAKDEWQRAEPDRRSGHVRHGTTRP